MALDVTGIEESHNALVLPWLRVVPNPLGSRAAISYSLRQSAAVRCAVYDAAGNVVSVLANGTQAAGEQRLQWNAAGVQPGVYLCRLQAGGATTTTRLTVAR